MLTQIADQAMAAVANRLSKSLKCAYNRAVWQYGGATNIFSASYSLFGFSSSRRITPSNRINNKLLVINLATVIGRRFSNATTSPSRYRYAAAQNTTQRPVKVYLIDQTNKFKRHLDFLKAKKVMDYDKTRLTKKTTTIDIDTKKEIDQLNLDFLFDYQIFPDNIMTFKTQWTDENRKIQIGDTIAQQVYLPPIKVLSQKVVFGVRINEIIDQADKKGFSYETLEGHVEKGISTFTVEQYDNKIVFKVQTYSTPGNILTKLLGPIFSVPYQTFCTKAALKNVQRRFENNEANGRADRITGRLA